MAANTSQISTPSKSELSAKDQTVSAEVNSLSLERYRSVFRPGLFDGKTVVVTGGGSGMGRCTAHELASLGARVALVGRQISKLKSVESEITTIYPELTGQTSTHACDIRDEDLVKATVAAILAEHGRIDGLFNCAGGQYPAKLRDITLKGWDTVVRSNLHGTFLFMRETYVQWMEKNGGSIVNILADIWGGCPGLGHTGSARGGVLTLTETSACEWGYTGTRVNIVAPGYIASAGLDHYDEAFRETLRSWRAKVPLQRFGTESEISSAVVFLLSEASAFISGSVIRVDGAVPNARPMWTLQPAERSFPYNGFPLYREPALFASQSNAAFSKKPV